MSRRYPFHIACNDDNGNFEYRANAIALGFPEANLDLGMIWARPPFFNAWRDRIKLGRKTYPIKDQQSWVGNWCWNAYYLEPVHAARLVHDLMRDKRFSCEGGYVDACEAWDAKDLNAFMRIWADALWPPKKLQIVGSEAPRT